MFFSLDWRRRRLSILYDWFIINFIWLFDKTRRIQTLNFTSIRCNNINLKLYRWLGLFEIYFVFTENINYKKRYWEILIQVLKFFFFFWVGDVLSRYYYRYQIVIFASLSYFLGVNFIRVFFFNPKTKIQTGLILTWAFNNNSTEGTNTYSQFIQ